MEHPGEMKLAENRGSGQIIDAQFLAEVLAHHFHRPEDGLLNLIFHDAPPLRENALHAPAPSPQRGFGGELHHHEGHKALRLPHLVGTE
jgi:hypothetical protein